MYCSERGPGRSVAISQPVLTMYMSGVFTLQLSSLAVLWLA